MVVVDKTDRLRLLVLIESEPTISAISITLPCARPTRSAKHEAAAFISFSIVEDHSRRALSLKSLPVGNRVRHSIPISDDGNQLSVLLHDVETLDAHLIELRLRLRESRQSQYDENQQ